MNKLLTNFYKREKNEILCCLKIANIKDFYISTAYDCFGNLLVDCYGLYIPEKDFEEKKYNIEMYHKTRRCFKQTLYEEYKKRGYNILPSNIKELYLGMDEEYVKGLCER